MKANILHNSKRVGQLAIITMASLGAINISIGNYYFKMGYWYGPGCHFATIDYLDVFPDTGTKTVIKSKDAVTCSASGTSVFEDHDYTDATGATALDAVGTGDGCDDSDESWAEKYIYSGGWILWDDDGKC